MIVNYYGWSFLIVMMDNTYISIDIMGHSETFPAARRILSGVKLQTCAFLVTKNRESSDFSDFTTKNSWVHQSSLSHPVFPIPDKLVRLSGILVSGFPPKIKQVELN